jgi:hypothetical protein
MPIRQRYLIDVHIQRNVQIWGSTVRVTPRAVYSFPQTSGPLLESAVANVAVALGKCISQVVVIFRFSVRPRLASMTVLASKPHVPYSIRSALTRLEGIIWLILSKSAHIHGPDHILAAFHGAVE